MAKKTAPKMSAEQSSYARAKATRDAIAAECEAEFTARGLAYTDGQTMEDFERVSEAREDVQERLGYWTAVSALTAAEKAMVAAGIAHAKAYSPAHSATLAELEDRATFSPKVWAKLVDITFRLAA